MGNGGCCTVVAVKRSRLGVVERRVRATAPVRICDIGGWTDTRVSGHGEVVNFAIRPGVEVQAALRHDGAGQRRVIALDYGESFSVEEGWKAVPMHHRLLAAAIEQATAAPGASIEVTVSCRVPPGSGTGTSAAVAVALLGALDAITRGTTPRNLTEGGVPPRVGRALARRAHLLEVGRLGQESGVQDQLASACGGVNHITITNYPKAVSKRLTLPKGLWWELEQRFVVVFMGSLHGSSALHEMVIASLAGEGPGSARLLSLRRAARAARLALETGDLASFAQAMIASTEAQADLHPDLVSPLAWEIIALARANGAVGWKVNGAGGEGGSLTLLAGPDASDKAELLRRLRQFGYGVTAGGVQLSPDGLRVWEAGGINEGSGSDSRYPAP